MPVCVLLFCHKFDCFWGFLCNCLYSHLYIFSVFMLYQKKVVLDHFRIFFEWGHKHSQQHWMKNWFFWFLFFCICNLPSLEVRHRTHLFIYCQILWNDCRWSRRMMKVRSGLLLHCEEWMKDCWLILCFLRFFLEMGDLPCFLLKMVTYWLLSCCWVHRRGCPYLVEEVEDCYLCEIYSPWRN